MSLHRRALVYMHVVARRSSGKSSWHAVARLVTLHVPRRAQKDPQILVAAELLFHRRIGVQEGSILRGARDTFPLDSFAGSPAETLGEGFFAHVILLGARDGSLTLAFCSFPQEGSAPERGSLGRRILPRPFLGWLASLASILRTSPCGTGADLLDFSCVRLADGSLASLARLWRTFPRRGRISSFEAPAVLGALSGRILFFSCRGGLRLPYDPFLLELTENFCLCPGSLAYARSPLFQGKDLSALRLPSEPGTLPCAHEADRSLEIFAVRSYGHTGQRMFEVRS